jgi:hypothetical protein
MKQVQIAARIDARVKKAVDRICKGRGLKMNRFVEDALVDKLEELEDVDDVKGIRFEPTRPVEELVDELGLGGEV